MTEFVKRNVIVFVYFVLILSTLLVYWQVRNFDFVNYDDKIYIYENPHVLNGLTRSGVIWAFTTNCAANWHPLTWLSHMLDCQLFGKNPGRMHLINLFLHLANTLLLFTVLRKMTAALWQSAFVAAAFALHPMHVESVAWIVERKDVLSALFWLLTMLAYLAYVRRSGVFRYALALALFTLGLMAKPMLVTLPFVLLLLDFWPLERIRNPQSRFRNLLLEKLPFLILSAISCVITYLVQRSGGAVMGIEHLSIKDRIANAFLSYARYTGKLFVPQNLAVFYPFDVDRFPYWQIVFCVLLLLSLSILAIYFGRKHRYLPVGWFWFVGMLVPVIGLVQVGSQAYADRYTYIPYIGLFIMLAWGLPELLSGCPLLGETSLKAGRYRKITLVMAASMTLTVLGIGAYRQVAVWNNSITLFSHAIEVTHNNAFVHNNLGSSYLDLKRYQDAIESCRQAIRINPGLTEAYANLGVAYEKLGRWQDAIENYKQALHIKPDWAEAHCRLGAVYGSMGNYQDALEMYKRAVKIDQALAEAHNGLGAACLDLGRYQESIEPLKQAIRIKPDYADAHYNLGNAYSKLGRYQDAIEPFKQAISFKPDYAEAHYNLGVAYGILGRYQESIDSFKQSITLKPDWIDAHNNLGVTYFMAGDKDLALEEYKILKTLDAKRADQLYNLIQQK